MLGSVKRFFQRFAPRVELHRGKQVCRADHGTFDVLTVRNKVVRVIRVPAPQSISISSQDEAQTEDGRHYRIDTVQAVRSWPPALDLALRAVEHDFDNSLQEGTEDDMV